MYCFIPSDVYVNTFKLKTFPFIIILPLLTCVKQLPRPVYFNYLENLIPNFLNYDKLFDLKLV